MIGGARENVNRCLREWHTQGLVKLSDGWLILCGTDGLMTVVEKG